MKTINSLIITVLLVFVMLSGVTLIFNKAGSTGNLDAESLGLISKYDTNLNNLNTSFEESYDNAKANTDFQPNNNFIGNEVIEYFEHKNRIDLLRDTMNMAYKLPDIFFLAIPFVDSEDLVLYRNLAWFILWLSIIIAIVLALRTGKVTEEQ